MSERSFRVSIYKYLDALQATWWESIQQVAIKGTPDIIMCINGFFVALEFKKDNKTKPSKIQEYKLECIRSAGGVALVVCPENWKEIYALLKKLSFPI